jgi:hypothetical protein
MRRSARRPLGKIGSAERMLDVLYIAGGVAVLGAFALYAAVLRRI